MAMTERSYRTCTAFPLATRLRTPPPPLMEHATPVMENLFVLMTFCPLVPRRQKIQGEDSGRDNLFC